MENAWPYPNDGPTARARRVAHAYRSALLALDPEACASLDKAMVNWGQTWVAPRVATFGIDDWLNVGDAADLAEVNVATLRVWRSRGVLTGRRTVDGRWQYRVGDLLDRRRRR